MVNNQIEFNNKYSKETKEIEIKRNRNFQGQLVIEDYSELEKLNLRDIKNIDKTTLKNLPQLQECAIWNCSLQDLVIENCPQIKNLNVRRNRLTNLEFIKDLDNLEELELDGNDKLSEILEPYEDDWKAYQKDLQESNENTNNLELLRKIKVLEKEKEFSNIKYDELKKFLKGILVSLSPEEKQELSVELDKKIKRRASLSAPGMTKELMLNTEKAIKSLKEIKKELENELVESKAKIEELKKVLKEKNELYQEKERELETQQSATQLLLDQLVNKAAEKGQTSNEKEKENLQKEIDDLRQKLDKAKEREYELRGELKSKREEIERMNKTIEKAIDTPKVQNIQNTVIGSQSINTYQIQYNVQYQQLVDETEKQITTSLTNQEIIVTHEEQKVINKTILFLGTKELFINHRQATINNLIDCYNKLEKKSGNKLNRFTTAVSMTNIAGKLANIVPGGGVAEAPIGIVGDAINLTGTIVKEKDLEKFTKQFQEILAKDKKTLSLFDGNYLSLVNTIWGGNKISERGEIVSTIINTLNLVKTELSPFSNDHNAFSQSVSGVWQGRSSLELEEMKSSIEAVINNFQELKQKLQDQKEQLSKQAWFVAIEEKTDLLQEQQTQIQDIPKLAVQKELEESHEITNINLPNAPFGFTNLKTEIEKLKHQLSAKEKEAEEYRQQTLANQLQRKREELNQLTNRAKSKLGKESEFVLKILLKVQTDIVKSADNSLQNSLENLQDSLSKKLNKEEIEEICQKQKEVVQLEEAIEITKETMVAQIENFKVMK